MCAADQEQPAAMDALVPLVYDELRQIARSYFSRQPASFTLRPTDIVNEACLHLLRHASGKWENPEHFRAIATKKMWQVIVDHLKHRHALKRGGGGKLAAAQPAAELAPAGSATEPRKRQRVPLDTVLVEWRDRTVDLLDLADALDELAVESRRLRDIVMLHWFGGLKYVEVGRLLNLSASTVEKDFRYALAWLNRRLTGGAADAH